MIQIDDAGSGSLIGGTGIGIMRPETGEYLFKIIPLELFQYPHFAEKKYQEHVIRIVQAAFHKMKVSQDEPILVCRGYIFDALRKWLENRNYTWDSAIITDPLQERVEASFCNYVVSLGLPRNYVQHARYAFGFHRLLKWVFADFPYRSKLCKTGWKSWQKWSQVPIESHYLQAPRDCFCLKCALPIKQKDPIVSLCYTTNKPWSVDLHTYCWQQRDSLVAVSD